MAPLCYTCILSPFYGVVECVDVPSGFWDFGDGSWSDTLVSDCITDWSISDVHLPLHKRSQNFSGLEASPGKRQASPMTAIECESYDEALEYPVMLGVGGSE
jgi:hypothetical protein